MSGAVATGKRLPAPRCGRGFTLLEVMIAIAILGLGLTVILSSQAGLFSSSQYASNLTLASTMARCRMNELDVELLRDGYPLLDTEEEGPCCDDEYDKGFRCSWKIEKIELPEAGSLEAAVNDVDNLTVNADDSAEGAASPSEGSGDEGGEAESPLGAALGGDGLSGLASGLASFTQNPGTTLGGNADLGSLAQALGGGMSGGGLAGMAMSLVYPDLKPMLEASIRKVTVTVNWSEGKRARDLMVEQFLAFPQQGGFDPLAAEGLNETLNEVDNQLGGILGGAQSGAQPGAAGAPGGAR